MIRLRPNRAPRLRRAARPRIGPARPGDAPAIGTILSDWIDETDWMPRIHKRADEQRFAADLVARGWVSVARRRDGAVVGFLARDGADVVALYVARGARGQGVGAALLADAKRRSARLDLWTFQFNAPACRFYEAAGFCEIARTGGAGNDENLPDIRYAWHRDAGHRHAEHRGRAPRRAIWRRLALPRRAAAYRQRRACDE